ncbi:MAG TPA: 5-formyltetrahydrofolate cyclo-ligase [Symbiobacteriaceae bacterium]
MDKAALRRQMIRRRLELSPAERERLSRAAQEAVIGSEPFRRAAVVLLYAAFRGEVATDRIMAAGKAMGKRLVLPRVVKGAPQLALHEYPGDPGALVISRFGVPEPDPAWPQVAPGEIDLVVVPGVAFDSAGWRLGYGAGYYDRTLPTIRQANPQAVLVGLAYGFQVVPALPVDPHDVPMDALATEAGLIWCKRG